MERLHSILLSGVLILLTLCTGAPAFGKEIYESPESEQKVKDTMTVLQDGLDDLEDAVLVLQRDELHEAAVLRRGMPCGRHNTGQCHAATNRLPQPPAIG